MAANLMEMRVMSEAEKEQQAKWATLKKPGEMLCLLDKQQQIDLHGKLREYVRWLLTEQSDQESLAEFDEERTQFEAQLKEKVNAGTMSGIVAKQKRGEWMWQKAVQTGRSTAVFFTVYKSIDEGIVHQLQTNTSTARQTVGTQHSQIEAEQADKLRELIANPFELPQ